MQLSLMTAAVAAAAVFVSASPVMHARAPAVDCGGYDYYASTVNTCVQQADNDQTYGSSYPHTYEDYEGFDFSNYCSSTTFQEYPLVVGGYDGGSPGPDRCVVGSNGEFCGAIHHDSTTNNGFVQCQY